MNRPRDLPFEALAEATSTDWNVGRGELNMALKSIREQMPGLDDTELATEIIYRAKLYKEFMGPTIALTAAALAKHWLRVVEQKKNTREVTNASAAPNGCQTCDGMGLVLVRIRPSDNPHSGYEEYGICPDCRAIIP
jgi:hypothetical protein